uniref:Si:ch211-194b1.1 n=1 Tax=Seriola lalandi dorsalis TaxID=1841481 RepID=A0A3B4XUI4_SERLL
MWVLEFLNPSLIPTTSLGLDPCPTRLKAKARKESLPLRTAQRQTAPRLMSKLLVLLVLSTVANFDPDTFSCEVCGAQFETRRGLSSHARSHLRQLGISVSESSGAPIDLLYQIAKERNIDSQISSSLLEPLSAKNSSPPALQKDEDLEDMDSDEKPIPLSILAKAAKVVAPSSSSTPTPSPGASPAPPHSGSPSSVVRKAPISSLLPVSSPLRSPEHKAGGMKSLTSNLSAPVTLTAAKPLWAPQENDAPLNLTLEVDPTKDIVCQLCGAWFETRKGLSSHARAHLRHFGVEYSESKGSPIDLLNQLIDTDDFKHKASALQLDGHAEPRATSSSSLLGPPAKRLKSSSMQVFRLSSGELMALPHSKCEPPKEIGCEFCGEYFENRKGLSSHARSHLRQMGITEWSVNGSPIDTLREIITRRGLPCALPLKPLKTPPPSSPGPPRSPLSAQPTSSSGLILKLKPEPVQLEVTTPGAVGRSGGLSTEPLGCSWSSSDNVFPLNLVEPTRDIRCEFCGEYFENRKGLSSHARSHLRQMGITEWSVNGSPIDTLREVIQGANSPRWENAAGAGASEGLGVSGYQSSKFRKSPLGLLQSGSRLHKQGLGSLGPLSTDHLSPCTFFLSFSCVLFYLFIFFLDPSCELCGFYFENRKALASHARAHLRQFGVTEWCVNGSPIETLSAWMRSRPQKVLEMHRSYMQGSRSTLKKVRTMQSVKRGGMTCSERPSDAGFEPGPTAARTRRPLKHPSCPDGTERDSGPPKPPRTGTVPALVPKPPSYPLVKLVGKLYTLKCRFCEVEFHGPLSVQEDWIRHLQQHILKMNYNKPACFPSKESSEPQAPLKQLSRLLLSPVTMGTKLSWLICALGIVGTVQGYEER